MGRDVTHWNGLPDNYYGDSHLPAVGGGSEWAVGQAGGNAELANSVAVLHDLDEDERGDLIWRFETLPSGVQNVILQYLSAPDWRARSLDRVTLERIKDTREGYVLERHWLSRADAKFSMLLHAIDRIKDGLTPNGVAAFDEGLASLSERQLIAACIVLAG